MTLLTTLGILSLLLTAAFTFAAYYGAEAAGGQSRRSSIIEAWMNVAIGFSVNWLANFAILPLIGAHFTAGQNFWMGCIYTAISVIRSFAIRRWFNGKLQQMAQRLAGNTQLSDRRA
jgi:hypothetical protein